ncbi:MAG: di-trans,poly-cis-decaprenylcistransferase [Clostridia bacterium]|nr:di-trans,poly-cis-decaprenylcistransferase [Clostridia bacterium]
MKLFWKQKKQKTEAVQVDDRLQHIAFIMDGNGRWAQRRGMPREFGHSHGAATFKKIGRYCESIGIKYMTVYAFSTENWKRPQKEVDTIMQIFDDYIEDCFAEMEDDNVRVHFIGNLSIFSDSLRQKMEKIERETVHKTFMLNVAVNYGGREEITHACNELIKQGKTDVTEADISSQIYTAGCPDPDLIVRTGGDLRTSNFLLWQSAYAEYYFTDVLWPDFSGKDVDEAVAAFYSRKRRYGGV